MEKPQEGEDEAPSDQGDFTPRDYRDFSREPMAGGTEIPRLPFAHPSQAHFPSQLHLMLSQSKSEGYSHICSWQSHGRAFLVRDRQLFVDRVLPLYFRQTKFSSFQRQLNLYGFIRMARRGEDYGAYYHEKFLRSRPDIAATMVRVKSVGSSERIFRNEPNFYAMEAVSELTTVSGPSTAGVALAIDTQSQCDVATTTSVVSKQTASAPSSSYQNQGVFQEGTSLESVLRAMFPPRPIAPRPEPKASIPSPGVGQSVELSSSTNSSFLHALSPDPGTLSSLINASESILSLPCNDRSHIQVPVWQSGQSEAKLNVTATTTTTTADDARMTYDKDDSQELLGNIESLDSDGRPKGKRRSTPNPSGTRKRMHAETRDTVFYSSLDADDQSIMAQFLHDVDLDSSDDEN